MIKILSCRDKNYLTKLKFFLNKRRSGKKEDTKIVIKILKDIKKNKNKAVLKYEKKFSNNSEIKLSQKKINKEIKSLDYKIKRAIAGITPMIQAGDVQPVIGKVFSFDEAAAAHSYIQQRKNFGKVLLDFTTS